MNNRLNYWLLTTEYPPFHGGGISTYCYYTACMFAAPGISLTTFVPDDSVADFSIDTTPEKNRIIRFNTNRSQSADWMEYAPRLSYEFAQIVRLFINLEGKPDVIESQDYLGISYYLLQYKHLLFKELQDIPIIITLHSPAFLYLEYNRAPVYRLSEFHTCQLEKEAIKMADHIIAPTAFIAEAIQPYVDVSDKQLTVIRNPYAEPADKSVPAPAGNKIIYYGKLSPQKGSFELLSYFETLWENGFQHPLHIVGGTDIVYQPEQATMGQLVSTQYEQYIKKGLLCLHGKINPASLEKELYNARVIIIPSIVDNLPYAVIECMALGKIVLASVQGGQREMIDHGVNGFLFDHDTPGDFIKKLELILTLSVEETAALSMAAKEKVAAMYSQDHIGPQKLTLISKLIRQQKHKTVFPFVYQHAFEPVQNTGELLSVIIPCINIGKYLKDCISAINASDWPHIEILVIHHDPIDQESKAYLQELEQSINIKVYEKHYHHIAELRNFGAGVATGQWLAFLNPNDKIAPDYYSRCINVLRHYENVFFAGSFVQYFGESDHRRATFMPQPPFVLVTNPLNSSGLVYKKAAFLKAGLNDKKVDYGLEDYESMVNMLENGYNGVVLPECLFHQRITSNTITTKPTKEKLLYSYKYICEKHRLFHAAFAIEIINLLHANGSAFQFNDPSTKYETSPPVIENTGLKILLKNRLKRYPFLHKTASAVYRRLIKPKYPWLHQILVQSLLLCGQSNFKS